MLPEVKGLGGGAAPWRLEEDEEDVDPLNEVPALFEAMLRRRERADTAGVVYFLHLFVWWYGNNGLPSGATGMPYGPIKTSEPETNDFIKVLRGALVNTYNISIKHGTREFKTKRKNN